MRRLAAVLLAVALLVGACHSGAVSGSSQLSVTVVVKGDDPGQFGQSPAYFAPLGQAKRPIGQIDSVSKGSDSGTVELRVSVDYAYIPSTLLVQYCLNGLMFQPQTSGAPFLKDGDTVPVDQTLVVHSSC